jgi:phosphonatase-like hydrolase
MTPRLVVFDMAGTTVEDGGQVPAAFTAALATSGIAVTPDQISSVRGASKRQAIRSLVGDVEQAAQIYAEFQRDLTSRYRSEGVKPVAGAADAFTALRARGIKVALTTGFDSDVTTLLVAALGWQDVVDTIVCGDDVARGRPAPDLVHRAMANVGVTDPSQVATVGDTTLDLEAGAAAGVEWNVGVLSGAHGRDALERSPHTHILGSVAELRPLWRL